MSLLKYITYIVLTSFPLVIYRDSVQEEQLNVLKAAQFGLISELLQQDHLMTPAAAAAPAKGPSRSRSGQLNARGGAGGAQVKGSKLQKKTVGSQFRGKFSEIKIQPP